MLAKIKTVMRDQPVLRGAALRAASLVRSLARAEPGLYTLCYHRVPAHLQDRFADQVRFFRRHGDVVDADAAAERLAAGWPSRDRAFLLTFDDGYADTADVAMPVLRAEGVPATVFLVADWIDGPPASPRARSHMTRTDIRAWLDAGLQVGSHTATHRNLGSLDEAAVGEELARSRRVLSDLVGRPVDHFACPWGVAGRDFDPVRTPALARECGYRSFFTTRRGHARAEGDLALMPRHVAEPHWGLFEFDALMGR